MNTPRRLSEQGSTVLDRMRRKGVRIRLDGGQLRYSAPSGALTPAEREILRVSRGEIIALLQEAPQRDLAHLPLRPRRLTDRIPLAHSQVSHWRMYNLGERHHVRQVASATRLRGPLRLKALQASLDENVRRHEALRTQISLFNHQPEQVVLERARREIEVEDLTAIPQGERYSVASRLMDAFIMQPIDVTRDPLFGVKVIKLDADEHIMSIVLEHIISDGNSLSILVRDLMAGYAQALMGQAFRLPAIGIQFADYAVWQRRTLDTWIEQHGGYWSERVPAWRRLRFPPDEANEPNGACAGWDRIPVTIGSTLKEQLADLCRARGTTLAMTVFAVYAISVLRWCEVSEAVIRYQSNGRVGPEVENTIGYFSSALYLRVACSGDDRFVDITRRITEEYCDAYENADFCYLDTLAAQPEFLRNSAFNWQPLKSGLGCSELEAGKDAISCSPLTFVHPMMKTVEWDAEPAIVLFDTDREILGDIYFPAERFSVTTMERFARNFFQIVKALIRDPNGRVADLELLRANSTGPEGDR